MFINFIKLMYIHFDKCIINGITTGVIMGNTRLAVIVSEKGRALAYIDTGLRNGVNVIYGRYTHTDRLTGRKSIVNQKRGKISRNRKFFHEWLEYAESVDYACFLIND